MILTDIIILLMSARSHQDDAQVVQVM
jgi:hypothetical protein